MDELTTDLAIEREQGPSWARPNWPVAELDPVNLGLDPTEATIEKVAEKAKAVAAATGVTDEAAIRRAADDSIRAMMLIRTYRVRGHLAANLDPLGLIAARAAGRPDARLSRLHRRRPRPQDLSRRGARLRGSLDPPDPAGAAGQLLRHRSASNICTSTTWRSGASSRTGWRGKDAAIQLHAGGQALDPGEGDPRRAVGKIPRQEICRDQAVRPRRRRKRHSRRWKR